MKPQLKTTLAITLVTALLTAGGFFVWYLLSRVPTPPSPTRTLVDRSASDQKVSPQGLKSDTIVPQGFSGDFTNPFNYKGGTGVFENDKARVTLRAETLPKSAGEVREGEIVTDTVANIDTSKLFEIVDESKQLYRDAFQTNTSMIVYYQRAKVLETRTTQYSFITTRETDSVRDGVYFRVTFKTIDLSQSEKEKILKEAEKILLSQF